MRLGPLLKALEYQRWFVIAGVLLWLFLEFGYRFYVVPVHAYSGFVLEYKLVSYVEAWLIYLVLLCLSPSYLRRPSDYFLILLLFGLMAPLLVFYALTEQNREHFYIVLMGYALVDIFRRGRCFVLPVFREGYFLAIFISCLGAVTVSLWMVWSGGIGFFNLDLTAVYEFRGDVGSVINQGPMGYISFWAYKVFGPALLAVALWKRQFWLAAIIVALHVFWFGVSAHKSVLFYPLLVLFLWVWFRRTRALCVVPFAMAMVVCCVLLLYFATDYEYPSSMFIRRVFFVIANNTFDYYEFFAANEKIIWSNSVLSSVLDYPYDIGPARLIGHIRGTESFVNNTFLSTGYMHAGVLGIVIYAVLAGFIFRIVDSVAASGVPVWVAIAVLIVPSRSLLLNADLPTALLTHGIGVALFILLLLRSFPQEKRLLNVESNKGG